MGAIWVYWGFLQQVGLRENLYSWLSSQNKHKEDVETERINGKQS